MAGLSAQQLALLNSLMYVETDKKGGPLSDSNWDALWSEDAWDGTKTLGQLLDEKLSDQVIERIAAQSDPNEGGDHTTGAEWAAIIRAIKADDELCSLKCGNLDDYRVDGSKAACFLSPDGSQAYIVFKGTGSNEWPDNFAGLNQVDTPQQQAAESYVNYIHAKYGDASIVLSGHSKGGNKAQYATIVCPFVTECITFDAQGFGPGFMEAYEDRIRERGKLITAYNQSNDFVSPLMFSIAGTAYYLDGFNSTGDYAKNHAPITLFVLDAEGNLVLADADGVQSALSREIEKLTHYLLNTATWGDLNKLSAFLQELAPLFLSGRQEDIDKAWALLFDAGHAEAFGILIAYLSEYGGTSDLLKALAGMIPPELIALIAAVSSQFVSASIIASLVAAGVSFAFILLLVQHDEWLSKVIKVAVRKKSQIVYHESYRNGYRGWVSGGMVRDFSEQKKSELLGIVRQIEDEPWFDPRTWDVRYRAERFFGRLKPEYYQNNMNDYYRKVMDIDGTSIQQIERIFEEARRRDAEFARQVASLASSLARSGENASDALSL